MKPIDSHEQLNTTQGAEELRRLLRRIDGKGYKAYKDIAGTYQFGNLFTLYIDHVQGDPFAMPSKIRVRLSQSVAGIPSPLFHSRTRRIALQDFLARIIENSLKKNSQERCGSGKSGIISIDSPGQEVLERTSILVTPDFVEARMYVGLPADGRRILGRHAEKMLCGTLPDMVEKRIPWEKLPQKKLTEFVECVENQESIRHKLKEMNLVAFVANGANLPRESGASDRPLPRETVPFKTPPAFEVTLELPNSVVQDGKETSVITGMGISRGVTLIVGGGYHGKSTLLKALERGVYPHIPEDGREYVVSSPDAIKIRAEDGRRVERVDIGAFINNLPYGRDTRDFSTDNASGSTSQATNIIEGLELGADLLLLDEDTSATNFMIRDERMAALVSRENEPITPFLERIRELYKRFGVSSILVMGGSGDYFERADTVIMMKNYLAHDSTEEAKKVAEKFGARSAMETPPDLSPIKERVPISQSFDPSRGKKAVKIEAKSCHQLLFGTTPIELIGLDQLVDIGQTMAIGNAIHLASKNFMHEKGTLKELVIQRMDFFDKNGLDPLDPFYRKGRHPGSFARPRMYEIAGAINRLRTVRMKQK